MILRLSGFLLMLAAQSIYAAEPDCAALAKLPLAQATIQTEQDSSSCIAHLVLMPTNESHINVEMRLPLQGWNGRLQGIGNGGYAGSLSKEGLVESERLHYAAVATDTGHQGASEDASWALNHPEAIADFGYRAIHLMTVDAKLLIQAFYGVPARHAYFNACSDGGREALMEAQRFPKDYDGIIAGAPANDWTHLMANAIVNLQALLGSEENFIPPAKLPAIQAAALKACDANDGVEDGIIENPARCHFDTSVLLCPGAESDACLTAPQLKALNQLYAGSHYANGKPLFPGYPPGGEGLKGNWDVWITGPQPGKSAMYAYGTQFFKNMVYGNPDWDFRQFEVDRDTNAADEKLGAVLNSTNPDLRRFISSGGRLILYHGWDDAAIAAPSTIHYFEAVRKTTGSTQTDRGVRLFLVPGMQHCTGGNGASLFGQFGAGGGDPEHDVDAALVQWVEKGVPPNQIIAVKPGTPMTHLLCRYPATARYNGTGDVASASSYTCKAAISR